jgi:uncharacterized protein with WD repeat
MGRSSASHGNKNASKLPRKQWQTAEAQAAQNQQKVFREKTRVHKKDRVVDTSVKLKRNLNDSEKRVRALNKKLREIESLQKKAVKGEQLDEQQLSKLDQLGMVLEELEELGVGSAAKR